LTTVRIVVALFALTPLSPVRAETLVATDIHSRLVVGLKVREAPLQNWLPAGWQPSQVASGPSQGANLILGFVDRLHNVDGSGKPIGTGRDRYLAIVIPAKRAEGGTPANFVVRVYTPNESVLPGPYKTSVLAGVVRKHAEEGSGREPGAVTDTWEVSPSDGGQLRLSISLRRGPLTRSTTDQKFYSPVNPEFHRVYRTQQALDVVKSVAQQIDRVESLELKVGIPELAGLFDGTEQVISVGEVPWNAREIFLP
jgi:hypothetical protein